MTLTLTKTLHVEYKSKYRYDIEGLRAIAVLAVIINHFSNSALPSGYLGVDIFFVISGFVISSSLSHYKSSTYYEFLTTFYARRIRRLSPALLFCLTISSPLVALLLTETEMSLKTAATSIFCLSNMYIIKQSTNYFAASPEANVFLHTWSLSVEEQFYIVFPAILWISRKVFNKNIKIAIVIASASIASLFYFEYIYTLDESMAYFFMPSRFWELGAGSVLYFLISSEYKLCSTPAIVSNIFIVAIIAVLFAPEQYTSVTAPIGVSLTAGIIYSARPGDFSHRLLCHPWMTFIGTISYSLYLWHWIVIALSRWTVDVHLWTWTAPFQFASILLLGALSHKFVESPWRQKNWSGLPSRTIFYGLGASTCVLMLILALVFPLRSPLLKIAGYINPPAYENLEILIKHLPCHTPKNIDTEFEDCLEPHDPLSKNIYLIGDSHASNHYASIKKAIEPHGDWRVRYLIDREFIRYMTGSKDCRSRVDCTVDGFDKFLNFFDRYLHAGDVVIFSFSRDRVLARGAEPPRADPKLTMELQAHLALIKNAVLKHDGFMILVDDIPKPCPEKTSFEIEVIHKGNLESCMATTSESRYSRQGLTDVYKNMLEQRVLYFDPHDFLCVNGVCGVTIDASNQLIYGDSSPHFLLSSAEILSGPWREFLRDALH